MRNLWSTNDEKERFRAVALCLLLQEDFKGESEMNYAMVRGPM